MTAELQGHTFLVTGASAGIGLATVEALASRGGAVVLAARSEDKTQPILRSLQIRFPGAELSFLRLDLGDLASVRRAAEELLGGGRRLDVLVNNAGIGSGSGLTRDGFDLVVGTNYVGPYLFTKLLLPRLLEAPQGRIVNVSSRAHLRVKGIPWDQLHRPTSRIRSLHRYGVSKLLNVIHAVELARRHRGTRLTTSSLHPGVVASSIWRDVPWPLRPLMTRFMISNEEGARTSVFCATAPELATVSGRYYDACREAPHNPLAGDEALAQRLFDWTEDAIASALEKR